MGDAGRVRRIINTIIFGVFGLIVAIIFVRILLKVLGANPEAGFVVFWYQLSDTFVGSFRGIYPNLETSATRNVLEIYSVIAMTFYLILSLLSDKLVTSVTQPSKLDIANSFVDGVFKFVEFFLITRFLLKITGASVASSFVTFVYGVSAIIYEPFTGILPTYKIGNITFETSTLIAIIIIVIFDLVTESIVNNLRKDLASSKQDKETYPTLTNMQPAAPVNYGQPQQPANITINIPQPLPAASPQPQMVDRRTVQIFNPPAYQNGQVYPGQYENDLERLPPDQRQQLPQQSQADKRGFFNPHAPAPRHPFN